ncbi:MAG: hypothetical protein K5655_05695 [Lachnospiraceae bacterium]|nr:hypothetical protein [Lachnospiraceae bacterium]
MTALEIILLILGIAFIVVSCFIIDRNSQADKDSQNPIDDPEKLAKISEDLKQNINGEAGRIIADAQDKLEALSNDKIIAVGEYSDQVIEKIEADHKEVVFLYQMLCDKEKELKEMTDRMNVLKTECERVLMEEKEDAETKESLREEMEKLRARLEEEKEKTRIELENEKARIKLEAQKDQTPEKNVTEDFDVKGETDEPEAFGMSEKDLKSETSGETETFAESGMFDEHDTVIIPEPVGDLAESYDKVPTKNVKAPRTSKESKTAKTVKASTATSKTSSSVKSETTRKGGWESVKATDSRDTRMLSRNDEIIALYRQNKSVTEISRLLQMGQGEVKLIIDLYCR